MESRHTLNFVGLEVKIKSSLERMYDPENFNKKLRFSQRSQAHAVKLEATLKIFLEIEVVKKHIRGIYAFFHRMYSTEKLLRQASKRFCIQNFATESNFD